MGDGGTFKRLDLACGFRSLGGALEEDCRTTVFSLFVSSMG